MIFSSLLGPSYPTTETDPGGERNADADAKLLFDRIRTLVEAAGGSVDDILKMSVYVLDDNERPAINKEWLLMFPDATDRPARHIWNTAPKGIHWRFAADFTAVTDEATPDIAGKFVVSSLLTPQMPGTAEVPSDDDGQAAALFEQIAAFCNGIGGTTDNVASVMFYVMGDERRDVVNTHWVKMFPNTDQLPARQTINVHPHGVQHGNFGAVVTALL